MDSKKVVYNFGHSFLSRFSRMAERESQTPGVFLRLSRDYDVHVEGHPGLSFQRIFQGGDHYYRGMQTTPIDLLVVDLGTNDLCSIVLGGERRGPISDFS